MLYYLFKWLDYEFNFPGAGVFQYISFRAVCAVITSLIIMIIFGKPFIKWLRRKQIGETVRNLGLEGQVEKAGTPTMGGLLILAAIIIPTLLFADLTNIYILLMLGTTIWLGLFGFIDDYIKVFRHNKEGMPGRVKIVGQVTLGIAVGLIMMFNPDITIREKCDSDNYVAVENSNLENAGFENHTDFRCDAVKSTKTTIPFVKNHELDYAKIITWMSPKANKWVWLVYVLVVIFVITATSNAANLTDGIDGLCTGTSAIIGSTLALLAWVSGNIIFASYLDIMFLPNIGELTIFITAFVGATLGFLWYNSHPAQIFMGDTGSLAIGGIIAVFALLIRKELLIPILCGIFLVEDLSVIIQRGYFKFTKKKYGEGRRVFLMAPIHHHYQKKGVKEEKIVMRFYLVGIMLALLTMATLKLR
ncbi:MAG: phospho-N-acetylmuramoyl-pentapeptide-transferase [Bacteroidales bacterium]|nr:phospho-N-acetylmuramoyl-pentapeptide-transferase [Bacteroidales bacterium]